MKASQYCQRTIKRLNEEDKRKGKGEKKGKNDGKMLTVNFKLIRAQLGTRGPVLYWKPAFADGSTYTRNKGSII